jgi:hypothetical protein
LHTSKSEIQLVLLFSYFLHSYAVLLAKAVFDLDGFLSGLERTILCQVIFWFAYAREQALIVIGFEVFSDQSSNVVTVGDDALGLESWVAKEGLDNLVHSLKVVHVGSFMDLKMCCL